MSYDVVKSVRRLIETGTGDIARLSYILDRLENGKYLYLSDQRYLENLLNVNEDIINKPQPTSSNIFANLGSELKDINTQLERILQNKARNEKQIIDNIHTNADSKHKPSTSKNVSVCPKNKTIVLILSILPGLITLQGIGHIYLHKIAKGIGILTISFILAGLFVSYFLGMIKDSIPSFLQQYFIFVVAVGYFGLYAFQILDSHKLCITYNKYFLEHKQRPPWW